MKKTTRKRLEKRKRRINKRLGNMSREDPGTPVFTASNIQYELAERGGGTACGGVGLAHTLVQRTGLAEAIDRDLQLLKIHRPYQESDHVLNIAYNILTGGTCLEDLELRRKNEHYLNGLGAETIPDPTTAGDFCRRFEVPDVQRLMDTINEVRLGVWKQQPESLFAEARIDGDGVVAGTTGECKEGMGLSYNGKWGYHPLVISLANTGEPLYLVNRSGNRPSHEGAAAYFDRAFDLCRRGGLQKVLFRGDVDFSQTGHLDRWDEAGARFIFGIPAMKNLRDIADGLDPAAWKPLRRKPKYTVKTRRRRRPENVKERIVKERGYKNIRLRSEDVSELAYCPRACKKAYRMVVVRKNLSIEKGERRLFDDIRYFFYITNDRGLSAGKVVESANQRCDQENLNAQLLNGVCALRMPLNSLVSNWAYMVIASLAWTLKAWTALLLPVHGRWRQRHGADGCKASRIKNLLCVSASLCRKCRSFQTP